MKKIEIYFVIADVHGCSNLLKKAFSKILENAKDRNLSKNQYEIIQLGDAIDRGFDSKGCIQFLMDHPNIIAIKGNHEDFLTNCFDSNNNPLPDSQKEQNMGYWMQNGGIATLDSYNVDYGADEWLDCIPKDHVEWIKNLPTFYETEHYYFVHAGCSEKPLDQQNDRTRLWIRDEFLNSKYDWGKRIVHGHTPLFEEPTIKFNRINLDTGSVWTGIQHIAILDATKNCDPLEILKVQR